MFPFSVKTIAKINTNFLTFRNSSFGFDFFFLIEKGRFDQGTILETEHLTKERQKFLADLFPAPPAPPAKLTECAQSGTFANNLFHSKMT